MPPLRKDRTAMGPFFAATMLLLAAAEPALQVDVGHANWSAMPPLRAERRNLPTAEMIGRVQEMLASGQCALAGQTAHRFDLNIPYAVLVEPDGRARRVVVAESGCQSLETYVGRIVLAMADAGDFKRTGESEARWFASAVNFSFR
jgi:hypothetical protein